MSLQPVPPLPRPVHTLDFAPLAVLVASAFPGASLACEPMPGGASTRCYFRVKLPAGSGSAVAMFVPDGANAEEVAKDGGARGARWPFLEVRDLLAARGVDVPALHGEDVARGWLLLEDLGEQTLANFLIDNPARREEMYVRAVRDLARAQAVLDGLPAGSVVASRAFDEELLSWEMHHFREWAIEARGIALRPEDRDVFFGIAERLSRRIAAWPRAFVHRDYQSRNLMVRKDGRLCWIDFQDALLGPRVYDLVALLNDSYQVFEPSFVEARLDDYASACSLDAAARTAIGREFDLVTVQRKLKDAGRFVFIDRVKGNASFLKFVEPTIAKVRASLARLQDDEDMRALGDLLARVLR
ncbi:MAG TPA: phosphotransferase [Polyangiaceae bacterium]|nr:phosphotransferase [Polyangiaceae bacterium]